MAKRKSRKERRKLSGRDYAEKRGSGFQGTSIRLPEGVGFFSVKEAKPHEIEILPFKAKSGNPYAEEFGLVGEDWYERTFYTHRIGPENTMVVCPRSTLGKRCPVCDFRSLQLKDPNSDKDLTDSLKPQERQLWNVFDHGDAEKGVQVWDVSHYLFGLCLTDEVNNLEEEDEHEFFADREDGCTLRVGFKKKTYKGNPFYEASSINFKDRKEPLSDELLQAAVCLDDLLIIEPYDKIESIFQQTGMEPDKKEDDVKDDKDEPKDKPKASAKKKKTTKKAPPKKEMTAEEAGIKKGFDVEHPEFGACSVVKVSGDGTSLTLMDDDDEIHRAVGPEEVSLIEPDPVPDPEPDDDPELDSEPDDDDEEDWDDEDD